MSYWLIAISFVITAFGQNAWIPALGILASVCGYALFWKGMLHFSRRFLVASLWFAAVQGVQFSWLATTEYMGALIVPFYGLLILGMGAQFGLLSSWIDADPPWRKTLALAGGWVLCEGARLFFLCGCTWNPVGLSMACSPYSLQLASIGGIFGLSFWVIWTNLVLLKGRYTAWLCLALLPYLFGFCHQIFRETHTSTQKTLQVALIQTNLTPKEKDFKPPLEQWKEVFTALQGRKSLDLIILPEAALSFGAHQACYSFEAVQALFPAADFPPLRSPYALFYRNEWRVTNSFLAQSLANWSGAQVIIGLDDIDADGKFNAAFHFYPGNLEFKRYEKQILAPIGEYIPLAGIPWFAHFVGQQFGIYHSFDAGKEGKIFDSHVPIGISICLEETFSNVIRELRCKGAELLVSISNDAYFPRTKLGAQHFDHGRIRAVENGVPLLRACNAGVTGAVDCFGGVVQVAQPFDQVLFMSLPIRTHSTLYTLVGDRTIFLLSAFFLVAYLLFPVAKKMQTYKKELP